MSQRRASLVFVFVFCWKVVLLVFTAQPVPSNDAFFYDGAVVNLLLHGGYQNPTIIGAFPTSATNFFSAYPPLYQAPLLAWMSVFGTSAFGAMALHLTLFGLYMFVLFAIFRRLRTPGWCVAIAGAFLLVPTFHDRPDSFAHLLGILAIYAWLRSRRLFANETDVPHAGRWTWLMSVLVVMSLFTGLQIGAMYLLCILAGTVTSCIAGRERLPYAPLLTMVLAPVVLMALIHTAFPVAWRGFMENVRQTPSFTGLRLSQVPELLKAGRVAPGVLLAAALLPWAWFKQQRDFESPIGWRHEMVLMPALLAALTLVIACLTMLTANTVGAVGYLQPVIVAAYLTVCAELFGGQKACRVQAACFLLAMLLGSVRAVGMSTWGVACARDMGYPEAVRRIGQVLESQPINSYVVLSSAYLYEAVRHQKVHPLHSDWLMIAERGQPARDLEGLVKWKPTCLLLTQYDYFRRYEPVLNELRLEPQLLSERIENTATLRAPDSYRRVQRVLQHVSWAPVIVTLEWKKF